MSNTKESSLKFWYNHIIFKNFDNYQMEKKDYSALKWAFAVLDSWWGNSLPSRWCLVSSRE